MEIYGKIELKPMRVPNYVLLASVDDASIPISELDYDTAKQLIDVFVEDFWNDVGQNKRPPREK